MEFPFTIMDVAERLGLKLVRQHNKSADYTCPFCGGYGKLNLHLEKNVYRCNKCGNNGSMIALYSQVTGVDHKTAYKELAANKSRKTGKGVQHFVSLSPAPEKASAEHIDRCYRALLKKCYLQKRHRENLQNRGLCDEAIKKYLFRSVPDHRWLVRIISELLDEGFDLLGVPGFYINKNGEISLALYSCMNGILIPVSNEKGLIVGLSVRLDTPLDNKSRKYMWVSSAEKTKGCSSGCPSMFCGDVFGSNAVYVTEGQLKGIIAHELSGKAFLAVGGVNQTGKVEEAIKLIRENGKATIIVDAYDMDDLTNDAVKKGHDALAEIAKRYGFTFRRIVWDPKYKGIDDFLLACKNKI